MIDVYKKPPKRSSLFWVPVVLSIIVEILVIFVWLAESAMRHSAAAPMPKSLLVILPLPIALGPTIGPLAALLALLQFPAYGYLLGDANEKNKFFVRFLQIAIFHGATAAVAVLAYSI